MPNFSFNQPNQPNMSNTGNSYANPIVGMLSGIGALTSRFNNPVNEATPYYSQIPNTMKSYYNPYIEAGRRADPTLESSYNQLIENPQDLVQRLMSSFNASPAYHFRMKESQNALKNLQASRGMLYTPEHEETLSRLTGDLAQQEADDYLGRMLGMYNEGLGGLSGISDRGFNASRELSDALSSNLANQGNLAYLQQAETNRAGADRSNAIMSGIGSLLDFLF